MSNVRDILNRKGNDIKSINPLATLEEACEFLELHNIGALLILNSGLVAGIISERDIVRMISEHGTRALKMPVSDVMTEDVITASSTTIVEDLAELMLEHHIRHVPVVDDGILVGIVSIGDVLMTDLKDSKHLASQLEAYIKG